MFIPSLSQSDLLWRFFCLFWEFTVSVESLDIQHYKSVMFILQYWVGMILLMPARMTLVRRFWDSYSGMMLSRDSIDCGPPWSFVWFQCPLAVRANHLYLSLRICLIWLDINVQDTLKKYINWMSDLLMCNIFFLIIFILR